MKDIYVYIDAISWQDDKPEIVIKGTVMMKADGYIEIKDENGFTQIINLSKVFAIVY